MIDRPANPPAGKIFLLGKARAILDGNPGMMNSWLGYYEPFGNEAKFLSISTTLET